ncbi:MAG TPA: GNAT family N-acetyltransferase [Candidatus Nanoarchaeia archaeon]|nr:GNAT family N-acetyltransferase [Candidatus Nanoarchaeia archaeon]
MFIEGKKINLRQLKKSDDKALFNHANDHLICRYTTIPYPYTLKIAKVFIEKTRKKIRAGESYELGITAKDNDEIIGMAGLRIINKKAKVAEMGYWLGRKYWGQGIVSEAAALMLDFGFKKLKLNRVFARAMKPNIGSARVLKKNGFKSEGILRRHEYKMGKIYDVLQFGILKEEHKRK